MKINNLKYILLLLFCMIFTTGCGTVSEQTAKQAIHNVPVETPLPTPIYMIEDYPELMVLVNAQNPLPKAYKPSGLQSVQGMMVNPTASEALKLLLKGAVGEGIDGLYVKNGYRSEASQADLYRKKIAELEEQYGENAPKMAARIVAPPGTSEHQTGLAVDFGTKSKPEANLKTAFANTQEGKWLAKNAYTYGFALRYPPNKEKYTGYIYEPWHFRFVGKNVAEIMQKNGFSLEEYLLEKKNGRIIAK